MENRSPIGLSSPLPTIDTRSVLLFDSRILAFTPHFEENCHKRHGIHSSSKEAFFTIETPLSIPAILLLLPSESQGKLSSSENQNITTNSFPKRTLSQSGGDPEQSLVLSQGCETSWACFGDFGLCVHSRCMSLQEATGVEAWVWATGLVALVLVVSFS